MPRSREQKNRKMKNAAHSIRDGALHFFAGVLRSVV